MGIDLSLMITRSQRPSLARRSEDRGLAWQRAFVPLAWSALFDPEDVMPLGRAARAPATLFCRVADALARLRARGPVLDRHLPARESPALAALEGIKFSHTFGSDVHEAEYLNKKAALDLEKAKLQRMLKEFEDKQIQSYRKSQVTLQLVDSIRKQKEYRERAMTELNRSYQLGRTDIRSLIDAMNNYFSMEVSYSRAVGDYFIAINEYIALRDELIKD